MAAELRPRDLVTALAGAAVVVLAMAVTAALGLTLLGACSVGTTLAVVESAMGGSVTVDGGVSLVGVTGEITATPLGVTVVGALTLAGVLRVLLRGDPSAFAGRVALLGLLTWVFLAVLALFAQGSIATPLPVPAGARGAGAVSHLVVHASPEAVAWRGLLWVAVLLALCCLVSRRVRLPGALAPVRAVVSAMATVLVAAAGVAVLVGVVAASRVGGRVLGALLLGAPNAVVALLSAGIGVPWSVGAPGVPSVSLPVAVPVAVAVVLLLATGIGAAARLAGGPRPVACLACWLGGVTAVVLPVAVALSGLSVRLGMSVLGFELAHVRITVRGNAFLAIPLGLLCGALAGLLGGLIVYWYRARLPLALSSDIRDECREER